ncbi:histidine-containing phosphotransfer protein 1-like protein [Tanacetum coccineum]
MAVVAQLQRQFIEHTTSLYNEGYLDDQFTQLQKLQDESNPDFVVEVVSLFFEDSEKLLNNLATVLQQKIVDYKQVDSHVHQFKGSSSSIGAQRVTSVCVLFRNCCEEKNLDGCLRCLQQLKHEYINVRSKLEALFRVWYRKSEEDDSDEEDSDYIDDEDHMMNEVEVDMKEYLENIDKEVCFEWGCASDSENDGKRKKALRNLRREHEANRSGDTDSLDAILRWSRQGKTPVFTYPTVNGPNGSSPSKLKNIGGKWVKEKGASGSSSVVNKESGMMIKVGRKNGEYQYQEITCPWIEETIVINLDVLVRALQDQLERKYQLNVSESKIYKAKEKATLKVTWNGGHKYGVVGPSGDQVVVDVHERTCSCRKWELTGMPCWEATQEEKKPASELSSQQMVDEGKLSRVGKSVTCCKCHKIRMA